MVLYPGLASYRSRDIRGKSGAVELDCAQPSTVRGRKGDNSRDPVLLLYIVYLMAFLTVKSNSDSTMTRWS